MIFTIWSCENPSNIWELNCGPQIGGVNKLTGKMDLALLLDKWISLFSQGTFQFSVLCFRAFVRTSGNGLSHIQNVEPLSLCSTYYAWWTCLRYDNFFSWCWKLKNQSLKLVAITFNRSVRAVIVKLNGVLTIWAHEHAGRHMASINYCCFHFSTSRAVFESPFL